MLQTSKTSEKRWKETGRLVLFCRWYVASSTHVCVCCRSCGDIVQLADNSQRLWNHLLGTVLLARVMWKHIASTQTLPAVGRVVTCSTSVCCCKRDTPTHVLLMPGTLGSSPRKCEVIPPTEDTGVRLQPHTNMKHQHQINVTISGDRAHTFKELSQGFLTSATHTCACS